MTAAVTDLVALLGHAGTTRTVLGHASGLPRGDECVWDMRPPEGSSGTFLSEGSWTVFTKSVPIAVTFPGEGGGVSQTGLSGLDLRGDALVPAGGVMDVSESVLQNKLKSLNGSETPLSGENRIIRWRDSNGGAAS